VTKIDRINQYSEQAGLPTTCFNYKTNTMPQLYAEYGEALWSRNFHDFRERHDYERHSIGCTNCHDPHDHMRLLITSIPLDEALKLQGKDWRNASRDEMRSLVCAQCHVEYYFETREHGVAAKPHFPWDYGMNAEDIYRASRKTAIRNVTASRASSPTGCMRCPRRRWSRSSIPSTRCSTTACMPRPA